MFSMTIVMNLCCHNYEQNILKWDKKQTNKYTVTEWLRGKTFVLQLGHSLSDCIYSIMSCSRMFHSYMASPLLITDYKI